MMHACQKILIEQCSQGPLPKHFQKNLPKHFQKNVHYSFLPPLPLGYNKVLMLSLSLTNCFCSQN